VTADPVATSSVPDLFALPAADRVDQWDRPTLTAGLDGAGHALSGQLLTAEECAAVRTLYDQPQHFRSTIDMARYRFGAGQYRYFDHPLPDLITELRAAFYRHLLPVARDWASKLRWDATWPDTFPEWLEQCHAAGQTKPTPILLRYGPGDWNALHRDLYGDLVFPLQVVIGLDVPGVGHTGGEFVMVEQRPRAQSRAYSTTLGQGQALVFTTRDRPVASARGWSRAPMRHAVSTVHTGRRHTLGLVLHDAA
jgi:hypothetical protein